MKLNQQIGYTIRSNSKLYRPTTKRRVLVLVKHEFEKNSPIYLRVGYGRGIHNDGTYDTYSMFKKALDAFTEKPLLEFIAEGEF